MPCSWQTSPPGKSTLLPLESLAGELERPAVLGDGTNNVVGYARGDFSLHLQCHLHLGTDQAHEMRNHFVGNAAGVSANTSRRPR